MAECQSDQEFTGIRRALARGGEFWRALPRWLRVVAIVGALLTVVVICGFADRPTRSQHVVRYCTQCGFVETEDQVVICGFIVSGEVKASGTFLSRWLEGRQHRCSAHHWKSAIPDGADYILGINWFGCVPSRIFRYRLDYPLPDAPYKPEMVAYEKVLTALADVDEGLALQLAAGLLIPDDTAHWQWLEEQSAAGRPDPKKLAESFRQFERDHPHGAEQE